jgi:hypothetical protein
MTDLNAAAGTAANNRATTAPRGLSEQARADWGALAQPTGTPDRFDAAATVGLPEPVRRWLGHAIAPGTPLRSAVELHMHGEIRLGAWRRFTAVQRLTLEGGFVWAATAWLFGLPVTGLWSLRAADWRPAASCRRRVTCIPRPPRCTGRLRSP